MLDMMEPVRMAWKGQSRSSPNLGASSKMKRQLEPAMVAMVKI